MPDLSSGPESVWGPGVEGEELAFVLSLSTRFRLLAAVGLGAQHKAEQSIDHARITAGATHGDVRHNAHIALADDLHELHDGVALRAECFDTDAIRFGFRAPSGADGLGFAESTQPRGLGFAGGLLHVRIGR